MSALRCSLCSNDVPDGFTCCPYCNVGFAAALVCKSCNAKMQPGSTTCFRCMRVQERALQVPGSTPPASQSASSPQQLTPQVPQVGLPLPLVPATQVASTYLAGHYGVESEVTIPQGDVEIMNLMAQAANALQALAARMNGFRGHMELTRSNIRACRELATDLQEEIELRRGPRG